VFLREENAKFYTVGPYFISKLLVDLIPAILYPLISAIVVYWMVGLNTENAGKPLFFIFTCILTSCSGLGLGYIGGTMFSDAKMAIAVVPLLMMPFMLFAGFYKNSDDFASWIGWI